MAAKHFYPLGFLLLVLFNLTPASALERRFSDFKRCADEECSMLLCRGKAVTDFSGPDCRFLSFKKSETVFVYYKLSGRRADLWAGSVGNNFGYFPKDLLAVNHLYTDKELEIPAEETDFVCFETGYDKFETYDIDKLLGFSAETKNVEHNATSDQTHEVDVAQKEMRPSEEWVEIKKEAEHHGTTEVLQDIFTSSPELDTSTESTLRADVESDSQLVPNATERENFTPKPSKDSETKDVSAKAEVESVPEEDVVDKPASVSETVQIPELKTTLGTTFDAVTSDDETTTKVTPHVEEVTEEVEDPPEEIMEDEKETPLLSFSEETVATPAPETRKDEPTPTPEKNMWTSLGDAVFSAVTGVETTSEDVDSEEDDDEEEEAVETPQHFKEKEPPLPESPKYPEHIEPVPDAFPESKPLNLSETSSNSNNLLSEKDEERRAEGEEPLEEPVHHQTVNQVLGDDVFTDTDIKKPNTELTEPIKDENEVLKDPENESNGQDRATDQVSLSSSNESNTVTDEESVDPKNEKDLEVPTDRREYNDSSVQGHNVIDDALPDRRDDQSVMDGEIKSTYAEKPETYKQQDEEKNQPQTEETEKEQLLEDENAQMNSGPSDEPSPETTESIASAPEPEYSESIMRLALLREHFTEDKLERLHKLLGLQNLFKVEAMFSDLDTELQVTRLSNGGSTQDIENVLENILEASENSILDEIEKMMDNRDKERDHDIRMDPDGFDEEAELLDDFQELAFNLRQKYSTVSDSTPLANEKSPNSQDEPLVNAEEPTVHVEEKKPDRMSETDRDPTGAHHEGVPIKVLEKEGVLEEVEEDSPAKVEEKEDTGVKAEEEEDSPAKAEEEEDSPAKAEEEEDSPAKAEEEDSPAKAEDVPVKAEEEKDGPAKAEDVPVKAEEEEDIPVKVEEEEDIPVKVEEEDSPAKDEEEEVFVEEVTNVSDISSEEDSETKGDLPSFSPTHRMQKASQNTLESSPDVSLIPELEPSSSEGSMETEDPKAEKQEEEMGSFTTGVVFVGVIVSIIRNKTEEWTTLIISSLPEEWKPGETLFGCPWQAVVVTALVGVLTVTIFFWRTILAVKKREYLLDEQKLKDQIQALKKEKTDALAKISELQKQAKEFKEQQKQTKETASCTKKKVQDLESKVLEMEKRNDRLADERKKYAKLLEEERTTSLQNETRIEKLEKSNEKLQISRKKIQEALTKTTVLLDEVKIREDARSAQHKCVQKEYAALKEENKTLKANIKNWEDKHKELNEKIKVYQKSQKELEDSVVLKDHNVEVLSQLLADLEACDLQKGEISVLANGETTADKKTVIKNRIKQMMDVSRVQTTLTVIEEERDRFMAKLLNEEKSRKELEEKHQELEHTIGALKSDKSHIENQLKILKQKNEIMVEMYQQKENALQQRLTKEELERRSKENLLTEVGDKALEAEEQVKVLRQRIGEMEGQMKKTEQVYKEQIKEQENKTHSNWVNARNAERALSQEKIESSKLREKLAVITSQLNERRAPLFRPNSGQAAGPRQGDSYGPSPVSGGAPSPPIMIEGPRRPPSAPVGRRIDPYGPRPPSDPHGRFSEMKPAPGMDMGGPRSSSPANLDSSVSLHPSLHPSAPIVDCPPSQLCVLALTQTPAVEAQVESDSQAVASTESPEPGPGSIMVSPIRDSPGPMVPGPPPGPGPYDPRLAPPGPYRPPRPGPYQLPPGPFPPNIPPLRGLPPPANGHPGKPLPGHLGGDFGPPPANGHAYLPRTGPGPMIDSRGPPPPHYRPPPPLHPFGPMPPPHVFRGPLGPRPDLRFPGPRDAYGPPMDLPSHSAPVRDSYPPQNSVGAQGDPGPGLQGKQEPPHDSRPAPVQP